MRRSFQAARKQLPLVSLRHPRAWSREFVHSAPPPRLQARLNEADAVIADLTGKNPNVFYELGIAHVLGKPVVLLSQNIEDVPFDLRHHRVIVYATTYDAAPRLQRDLILTLTDVADALSKRTS